MTKINMVNYDIDLNSLLATSQRGSYRIMLPEEITLSYSSFNKAKKRCMKFKVRIGDIILKHLKWDTKTQLSAYHFPEDLKRVVLLKKSAGCRAVTTGTAHPFWQFTLMHNFKFMPSPQFSIDYEVHKLGYLIINLEDPVVA